MIKNVIKYFNKYINYRHKRGLLTIYKDIYQSPIPFVFLDLMLFGCSLLFGLIQFVMVYLFNHCFPISNHNLYSLLAYDLPIIISILFLVPLFIDSVLVTIKYSIQFMKVSLKIIINTEKEEQSYKTMSDIWHSLTSYLFNDKDSSKIHTVMFFLFVLIILFSIIGFVIMMIKYSIVLFVMLLMIIYWIITMFY